jgi:two-component system NtrC family sensor kinase
MGAENRHRIVVIDDSATYLKILKTYLEREGYDVHPAMTGEEGLALVGRVKPHLILCDYLLPGMKGDEFCKQVKLHGASRNIPVIMLTARGDREDITTGLDAGADDYIIKSQDIDILLLRVKNFLRQVVAEPDTDEDEGPALARQKVLTIEDDAFYRAMIARLLTEEGYEVHQAGCGEDGLAMCEAETFDLILVDFIMPGLQGDEVCRKLKQNEATREIPVILLTSRGDKQDMIAGLNAGADDYIIKSTDVEVLKSRVKALIRRKAFHEENKRIQHELKSRELAAERAQMERDLAQEKAMLADQLADKNSTLEATNMKLRETQTALVQAEKMAALGQLVAGIAHEINNPLAFVYNNLVTIERDAKDLVRGLDAYRDAVAPMAELVARLKETEDDLELLTAQRELMQYVEDSKEGLDRVKNIILNLRNFSRLDEGEVKVVDVADGVESTLKILAHVMKDRIDVEREYHVVSKIEAYPGLLNQVFMNLLANAAQAIQETGRIRIRIFEAEGTVRVAISDSGCGIPPELLRKIFDPFFTTKPVGSGTGLGLSTSYGIMQKHGGQILVDSIPGQGSTFTVVLNPTLKRQHTVNG